MLTTRDPVIEQFIDAGVRSLVENPRQVLERGLRSEDIVNNANGSQATFFRKFATKADFIDTVVAKLTDTNRHTPAEIKAGVEAARKSNDDALRPTVIALVAESFESLTDETSSAIDILARIFGNAHAIKTEYARRDALVLAAFEALFERTTAALRRPFTARTFAITAVALLDGFRNRSAADPSAVTPNTVSDALLALLSSAVDSSGEHQHLDDRIEPIRASASKAVPRDPRAAILTAARAEFGKRGYFMTRLDDIADDAGVPRATMTKLFPTKPEILVAALRSRVDGLRESVADDLLIGLEEIVIIDNFLLRCAQLADEENAFMDALLVAVAHDTYGEPEGLLSIKEKLNIPGIIGPVIRQGQDNGTLARIGSPVDLAAGITNTLLMRCFTRRHLTPEENATFIGNLLLRGLRL